VIRLGQVDGQASRVLQVMPTAVVASEPESEAGQSLEERRARMAAARMVRWGVMQPCGTEAAYRRHRRAGKDADEACLRAHALYAVGRRRDARSASGG
jgi:hypothetical protein